jgi:hypothetical protein
MELFEIPAEDHGMRKLTFKESLRGKQVDSENPPYRRLFTPAGEIDQIQASGRTRFSGASLREAWVQRFDPLPIPRAKSGLAAEYDGEPVRIWRPRFTFRFKNRDALLVCGDTQLRARHRSRSEFEVFDDRSQRLIGRMKGSTVWCDPKVQQRDLVLSLLLMNSGIMQWASLATFITF